MGVPDYVNPLVFPACAGVSLRWANAIAETSRFPRVCGGEPVLISGLSGYKGFSPRVRG